MDINNKAVQIPCEIVLVPTNPKTPFKPEAVDVSIRMCVREAVVGGEGKKLVFKTG